LFGVKDKTGDILGLSYDEIQSTSRELGNTANEQVRPLIYIQTEVVWFYGNSIAGTQYKDSRDIEGTLPEMYEQGIPRVLAEKSKVEFVDDKEGNQFVVRISRLLAASEAVSSREQAVSNEQLLLAFCVEPRSLKEICEHLGLKDRYKAKSNSK